MKPELLSESPAILREFLGHIETILGKSRLTAEEYFIDLRTFFRWLKLFRGLVDPNVPFDQIPIDDVDLDLIGTVTLLDVYEYMNYLATERNNHAASALFFIFLLLKSIIYRKIPCKTLEPQNKKNPYQNT